MATGNGRKKVAPKKPVLNALTRQRTARQVAERLASIQESKLHLELLQEAEDHKDTDAVPGSAPKMEDGNIIYEGDQPVFPTYGERYAEHDAAEARVWARADSMGVRTLVERMIEAEMAADE